MKIREFIEDAMIKVLDAKASNAVSHKKAAPFRKMIEEVKLIGWKVNGDIDLMDVELKSKEFKFNRLTGEQYVVMNDNIIYSITDNRIYRARGGFGTCSEFSKKYSRKTKVRVMQNTLRSSIEHIEVLQNI